MSDLRFVYVIPDDHGSSWRHWQEIRYYGAWLRQIGDHHSNITIGTIPIEFWTKKERQRAREISNRYFAHSEGAPGPNGTVKVAYRYGKKVEHFSLSTKEVSDLRDEVLSLGCVDIWCIMDTCQRLNYAMNNGRKSLNFCAHAQTSTLERRTIAGATSRPSCGWHEVVLLGDCCLSTTVTGTAYISASHAGVKRVYGNECISILCKTPIWSMSSLIAL